MQFMGWICMLHEGLHVKPMTLWDRYSSYWHLLHTMGCPAGNYWRWGKIDRLAN